MSEIDLQTHVDLPSLPRVACGAVRNIAKPVSDIDDDLAAVDDEVRKALETPIGGIDGDSFDEDELLAELDALAAEDEPSSEMEVDVTVPVSTVAAVGAAAPVDEDTEEQALRELEAAMA